MCRKKTITNQIVRAIYRRLFLPTVLLSFALIPCITAHGQGLWTPLTNPAPDPNSGVMLLLTDGSVIVKTAPLDFSSYGYIWNKLTPDSTGSYINGTWSYIAPMAQDRLYFSSQILKSGKVYVAGGEYGEGRNAAEIYDPVTDIWSAIPGIPLIDTLADANSSMLPDGRVLQNVVYSDSIFFAGNENLIYDPVANTFGLAAACIKSSDESAWIMLPDNSVLYVDLYDVTSERYIPALDRWIPDAPAPVLLYDDYAYETGASILLPDGRVLFLGSNGTSALYTPSGDTTSGSWTTGPMIPNGCGTTDAAAAMMSDGRVLCAVSPVPSASDPDSIFHNPTYFYEYDYTRDTFIAVSAPLGQPYIDVAAYTTNMLDLPDGNILFVTAGDYQYHVYTPGHTPIAAGKPTISAVTPDRCEFMITGTLFNGISQGAAYGDDWQMATNYPIVSLKSGSKVVYARTHDWNRVAVQTGSLPDTAYFSIPASLPNGNYSLTLSANGIGSDPFNFSYINCTTGVTEIGGSNSLWQVNPNPASGKTIMSFSAETTGDYTISLTDICGRVIKTDDGRASAGANSYTIDISGIAAGVYTATLQKDKQSYTTRLVVK